MYRHGDLLLKRATIPEEAQEVKDMVLAYGETTGHRHRLVGQVQVFESNSQKYIQVKQGAQVQLVHEEHHPIQIESGDYVVVHEREFEPFLSLIRQVRD